jgi:hypothetical protein
MDEREMEEVLRDALINAIDDGAGDVIVDVRTYLEAGVRSAYKGLVVTTRDGTEFQLMIMMNERGTDAGETD